MHTLIFDKRDISLSYENHTLIVRQQDTVPSSIPLTHIRKIVCLHSVSINTQLLGQLWQHGIDFICLNNRYSERSFALHPNQTRQVQRRCTQYAWQQHETLCLPIAQALCQHRIKNALKILPTTSSQPLLTNLQKSRALIQSSQSLQTLRGIESAAQRQLFAYWREYIDNQYGFTKRKRRPATDPINAMLSLTYTLALHEAIRQCVAAGLDSQLGFYHRASFSRHSLACDLLEPLRPYCERFVFSGFKTGLFHSKYFTQQQNGACFLGKKGRQIFYQAVDNELPTWKKQLKASSRWLCKHIDLAQGDSHANTPLAPHFI